MRRMTLRCKRRWKDAPQRELLLCPEEERSLEEPVVKQSQAGRAGPGQPWRGGGTCMLIHKNVSRNRVECRFGAECSRKIRYFPLDFSREVPNFPSIYRILPVKKIRRIWGGNPVQSSVLTRSGSLLEHSAYYGIPVLLPPAKSLTGTEEQGGQISRGWSSLEAQPSVVGNRQTPSRKPRFNSILIDTAGSPDTAVVRLARPRLPTRQSSRQTRSPPHCPQRLRRRRRTALFKCCTPFWANWRNGYTIVYNIA